MKAIMIGPLMAMAISTAATADGDYYYSANFVLPGCKGLVENKGFVSNAVEAQAEGTCAGILHVAGSRLFNNRFGCVSIPREVTIQQEARVIVPFIEARPHRMHEPFVELAAEALHNAWPCRR